NAASKAGGDGRQQGSGGKCARLVHLIGLSWRMEIGEKGTSACDPGALTGTANTDAILWRHP
ncbi:hypothetical protein, partial [Candidatus Accumulibacter vicinus]|uniref:hypothetical protein n=1 Tax=Candidatus Accumulibacter vicinus TaxID=2954382 RepID=UPI00235B5EAC